MTASDDFLRRGSHRGTTLRDTWTNAVTENFYEAPATDREILGAWCYTDRLSYAPGDAIQIHVCTSGTSYDLRIYRDGAQERTVFSASGIPGAYYDTPVDCSIRGCGWPVERSLPVQPDWQSGGYILEITGYRSDGARVTHHFPFAVRSLRPSTPSAVLLLNCSATWVAYNDWGGSNFYEGITGEQSNRWSPVVSTLRPFSRGFGWLPDGSPRIPWQKSPKAGAALRYPHMEWAYANGFSKKYASAGWASYERHFLRWAEQHGFTVDVATQHDLHRDAALLNGYRCVAIVGHDEYWSWEMRDAIEAYVAAGGRIARFAGNFTWQIRLEESGTKQVCYKTDAHGGDPVRDSARKHLLTTVWADVAVGRSGTKTFGLDGTYGIYAGWGGCVPRGSGGFTVYRPHHWSFAGTDLYYGDLFGHDSKVFGYEVDGCDYTFRDGLPFATGVDGAPDNLEILAMGLATTVEEDHGHAGSIVFIGDHDAKGVAFSRLRRTDPDAVDKASRGSGMMVCFDRGKGSIFNAASCEWVSGLIAHDPAVEQITRNVLERFTNA